ncbi:hypothetical protein NDU88_005952 [Pleurodeles waltl]|uniref:Uncharacterized protein n=1 Tax=Pleurodeles waltl TaxID=8319 RepID=A0AAV7TWV8_PLEWA|nr:hypothetical protein NDU88_005952 [Pleurodeles waltl]
MYAPVRVSVCAHILGVYVWAQNSLHYSSTSVLQVQVTYSAMHTFQCIPLRCGPSPGRLLPEADLSPGCAQPLGPQPLNMHSADVTGSGVWPVRMRRLSSAAAAAERQPKPLEE